MTAASALLDRLQRLSGANAQERQAALWSFAYFFTLLAGYYVLRPLRDQMGIEGGVRNLPWLFTATFVTMLLAQPLYGALVARLPRARFIPIVYHFFVLNLFLFWLALTIFHSPEVTRILARVFFVWVSIFNLFAVAVFWSFMADLFTAAQSKRLFGFIGAGGTAGALLGPTITMLLVKPLGRFHLLIIAALFMEFAVFCVRRIEAATAPTSSEAPGGSDLVGSDLAEAVVEAPAVEAPLVETIAGVSLAGQRVGGSAFAGLSALFNSPYLLGIAFWVSLLSFAATVTYFAQAHIVAAAIPNREAQTELFAAIDLGVNLLSLATQILATSGVLKRFGTGISAAMLPLVYVAGFSTLAVLPVLTIVVTLQVVQRWINFALANPARHIFFTVVGREEKYKVKNMIDVVIYRGSDALSGWIFTIGPKLGTLALLALPVVAAWALLSLWLGRMQERLAADTQIKEITP
ncbi:MAG: MFS transporter [Alphaproteobacteria bacterium]|nr:MFS transporter [Alphaproteobacteria bacterium]